MKIQGLNRDDFEWIDNAFRFLMSSQAKQIKRAAEYGSSEMIRDNMESLESVLKTYEKVKEEMDKYNEKGV